MISPEIESFERLRKVKVCQVWLRNSELPFHDWREFKIIGTAVRWFTSGHPCITVPTDTFLYRPEGTGGRQQKNH